MTDGQYDEEYMYENLYEDDNPSWYWRALNEFMRRKKVAIAVLTIIGGFGVWWVNDVLLGVYVFLPVIALMVFFITKVLEEKRQPEGSTWVIAASMAGQVLHNVKHRAYQFKPVMVQETGLFLYRVPNFKLKNKHIVHQFGTRKPPVHTNNIVVCEWLKELPNGEILISYGDEPNFSTLSFWTGANEFTASSMEQSGEKWSAEQHFKDTALKMYKAGEFGTVGSQAAKKQLGVLMRRSNEVQLDLQKSQEGYRELVLFCQYMMPRLMRALVKAEQQMPQIATAEAVRIVHQLHKHPLGEGFRKWVTQVLQPPEHLNQDFVQSLMTTDDENPTGPMEAMR